MKLHNLREDLKLSRKQIFIACLLQYIDYILLPVIMIVATILFILSELCRCFNEMFLELKTLPRQTKKLYRETRRYDGIFSGIYGRKLLKNEKE